MGDFFGVCACRAMLTRMQAPVCEVGPRCGVRSYFNGRGSVRLCNYNLGIPLRFNELYFLQCEFHMLDGVEVEVNRMTLVDSWLCSSVACMQQHEPTALAPDTLPLKSCSNFNSSFFLSPWPSFGPLHVIRSSIIIHI